MIKNQDLLLVAVALVAGLCLHGCDKDIAGSIVGGAKQGMCEQACAKTKNPAEKCTAFCKCALVEKNCLLKNETAVYRKECLESCEQELDIKAELAFEDLEGALAGGHDLHSIMAGALSQKVFPDSVGVSPHSMAVGWAFGSVLFAVTAGILGMKAYLRSTSHRGVAVEEPLNDGDTDAEEPVIE